MLHGFCNLVTVKDGTALSDLTSVKEDSILVNGTIFSDLVFVRDGPNSNSVLAVTVF